MPDADPIISQVADIISHENGESYASYFEDRYDPDAYEVVDGDGLNKVSELIEASCDKSAEDLAQQERRVQIAGRITSVRVHANYAFVDITDDNAVIQIIIDRRGEDESIHKVDDIRFGHEVVVSGIIARSRKGELSILADQQPTVVVPSFINYTKSSQAEGLDEYTQKVERFTKRRAMKASIRRTLEDSAFAEITTPILNAIPSGGNADAFVTHVNALEKDAFLRIAPELYLKTAIIEGFAKRVYEFATNFRNEGIDREHAPEFEMLEFYASYWTVEQLRAFTTTLVSEATQAARGTTQVELTFENGMVEEIDLALWRETTFRDIFLETTELDLDKLLDLDSDHLKDVLCKYMLSIKPPHDSTDYKRIGIASLIDKIFKRTARPSIIQPTFVTDYPAVMIPLARPKSNDARYVDMFQGIVGSMELIKGYQELNDPVLQLRKLSEQSAAKNEVDNELMEVDWEYIRSMLKGLPPTAGCGIGIDRLAAIIVGTKNIHLVMPFAFRDRFK